MAADSMIDYEALAQDAMRDGTLFAPSSCAACLRPRKTGLPGEHHFYISFDTLAPGVILSKRLAREVCRRDDDRSAAPLLGPGGQRCTVSR